MFAIGSDHGGYKLKEEIKKYLDEKEIKYVDCGSFSEERVDYPDIAKDVAEKNINSNNLDDTENLENKLKNILSKIQGVGEVEVCLNYSETSEVVAMYNENSITSTTEETDDTGGSRKIEETDIKKDVIFEENDGTKTPITAKVIKPKIEGAIITAQGVNNAEIKNNIIQAVEAVTGLATHKIQVFEMNV